MGSMNIEDMGNMEGIGWMMSGVGLVGILTIILLILGIAALVKYLFFTNRDRD